MGKEEVDLDLDKKLQGIMEYYIRSFLTANKEQYLEYAQKMNIFGLDPDIIEKQAEDYLEMRIEEATDKFHSVAFIILRAIITLKEAQIREFELLFIDLIKRTLLKDVKEEIQPISIVIADPNVGSEEN